MFTFLMGYNKGTYISQINADTVIEAINKWCIYLLHEVNYLNAEEKQIIFDELKKDENDPVKVKELENVWCIYLFISKKSCLINIIKTDLIVDVENYDNQS